MGTTEDPVGRIVAPSTEALLRLQNGLGDLPGEVLDQIRSRVSLRLTPENLEGAVGALRFAIDAARKYSAEDLLALLTDMACYCADRALQEAPPRGIEISGKVYLIDSGHVEGNHFIIEPTVWVRPNEFNSNLACVPNSPGVRSLRKYHRWETVLVIELTPEPNSTRRRGRLSLQTGIFNLE